MKIAFAGSHGTGKSTMARWLAERLEYTLVPDISRELRIIGLYPDRNGKKVEHYAYVMWKQIRLEQTNDCFIADGALWGTVVYSVIDGVNFTDDLEETVSKHASYDRIFYMLPDIPLKKDSIRKDNLEYQQEVDEYYRDILDSYRINYIEVGGDLEERQRKILNYIPKPSATTVFPNSSAKRR
jgi:nicotinamide riboside kinase